MRDLLSKLYIHSRTYRTKMGIKCPKCKSTDTTSTDVGRMHCRNCAHSWKPYKHRGKKMKVVGDGITTRIKTVMPGSKTETIGDGIIFPIKRVKKSKI